MLMMCPIRVRLSAQSLTSGNRTDQSFVLESPVPSPSLNEFLQPLQETADRVSRQLEDFAKALDKFNAAREASNQELWKDAWLLLDQYREITNRRKDQTSTKFKQSPVLQKSKKKRDSLGDTERQVQNLQLEADLWNLTSGILVCKSPEAVLEARTNQDGALTDLHRYSSPNELWNAFLDTDIEAQEYESILDWLQIRAKDYSPTIEDVIAENNDAAEHGDGIWSAGLIYTKDAIKKQKRGRSLPIPLTHDIPGLSETHRRSADGELIVTQLDPDAPLRQDACLEVQDEFHELAAWQAYWEMLRRGWSTEESRQWWIDRNETWRAAVASVSALREGGQDHSPWQRIANLAACRQFASRCKDLAENRTSDTDFETAVYGVLAGCADASLPVCNSIEDCLFSLVNSLLIERYDDFLHAYSQKLHDPTLAVFVPGPPTIKKVLQYIERVQSDQRTRDEAHQPYRVIEAAIVAQSFEQFFVDLGRAAASAAEQNDTTHIIRKRAEDTASQAVLTAAIDEDTIRVAVHLQLALRTLGLLDQAYTHNHEAMDNNIINYVGLLEKHQKFSLIPLYAAKLAPERSSHVLAPIFVNVTETKERDRLTKLMSQYGINLPEVIHLICEYARRTCIHGVEKVHNADQCAKVTEYNNKIVRIRSGFLSAAKVLTVEEQKVVDAHDWVKNIDVNDWGLAAWSMAAVYKSFLLLGKLHAAKELAIQIDLASTSLKVTKMNLSVASMMPESMLDDGDAQDVGMDESQVDYNSNPASPSKRRKEPRSSDTHPLLSEGISRSSLTKKSLVWSQLEQLVSALDALDVWQNIADNVEANRSDMRQMKQLKKQLREALQLLIDAMQPVLEEDFLNEPYDEDERFALDIIRNHYVPECVLAYNSALYFAGHALTRQHLVQCMELAQQVAQTKSLTNAFVASKRMQELVTAFALDSQALLRANEAGGGSGKGKSAKRHSSGEDVYGRADIWRVTWNENDVGDTTG